MIGAILLAAAAASAAPADKPCLAAVPLPTAQQAARGKDWYASGTAIEVFGKVYRKYGLPRVLGPGEVEKLGEHDGVIVAVEAGSRETDILYLLTDAACEFQPYVAAVATR